MQINKFQVHWRLAINNYAKNINTFKYWRQKYALLRQQSVLLSDLACKLQCVFAV